MAKAETNEEGKKVGKAAFRMSRIILVCFTLLVGLITVIKICFLFSLLPNIVAVSVLVIIIIGTFLVFVFWKEFYSFFSWLFEQLDRKTTAMTAVLYIILISLALKIAAIFLFHINSLSHPDINVYVTTASELIKFGRVYKYGEYCLNYSHMFWFAHFLTPVIRVFGENFTALSVYLACVGTISELFLYDTVRRNFSKKKALAVFTVFSLLPSQILLPSFITHEQAMLFFLSFSVWLILGIYPELCRRNQRGGVKLPVFALSTLALAAAVIMNMQAGVAIIALCIVWIIEGINKHDFRMCIRGLCVSAVKCLLTIGVTVLAIQFCTAFQLSHTDQGNNYEYASQHKVIWTLFVGSNAETAGQWSLEDTEIFNAYPGNATLEERNAFETNLLSERYQNLIENHRIGGLVKAKGSTIWSYFAYPISYANETISNEGIREIYNRFLFKPLTCIEYGLSVILLILGICSLFSLNRNYTVNFFYQFTLLYLLGITAMLMFTECTSKYTITVQPFFVISCIVMCKQEQCIFFRKVHDKLFVKLSKIINRRYEEKMRAKLQADNFSIICSNCIGGTIYHRLGKQFLSPTINCWMHQSDFLKFVFDLKYYLSLNLEFIETEYNYPVALCGDVKIFFNHSKTKEEAAESWNRRKGRVNYDNLFVIMYDRGITEGDIRKLGTLTCKNKIVLSDKPRPIDYVLTMKPHNRPNGEQFLDRDSFGMRTYEKHFDYVKWLNCQ